MRSPRVPLFATSWSPAVSSTRPAGAAPGAKVFQVAPVVEVSATAGDEDVTGNARMILGAAEGEAAARDVASLGEASASVTGWARGALSGVEAARATATFSSELQPKTPLRLARSGGGGGLFTSGTAGSTRTSASSGGGAVLTGGSPTIGSVLVAGARRDR